MALHPALPRSPYEPLDPAHRWFPADEALRASSYERLLPPLVFSDAEAEQLVALLAPLIRKLLGA